MDGSISASAAIARIVALRKPSAANLRRAASRIAVRVASDRRGLWSAVMPTNVGQQMLTCQVRRVKVMPTNVGQQMLNGSTPRSHHAEHSHHRSVVRYRTLR